MQVEMNQQIVKIAPKKCIKSKSLDLLHHFTFVAVPETYRRAI